MPLPVEHFLLFTAIFILLGWGVYLPYRAGQLTLAPAYCMAAGAYVAAYGSREWGWPFPLAVVAAMAVGAFFAFVPALGLRRAPGFTTAIASIALITIFQTVIDNLTFLGGAAGFFGIRRVRFLLPATYVLLLLVGVFVHRLDTSRTGRAAEALLVDRDVAASMGVDIGRVTVLMHTCAGALGGLAGVIYAFTVGSVFPAAFGFSLLIFMVAPLFVGGTYTMWGVVVLVPVLWGLPLLLPSPITAWKDILVGGILVVALLVRPDGLIGKATARALIGARWKTSRSIEEGGSSTKHVISERQDGRET